MQLMLEEQDQSYPFVSTDEVCVSKQSILIDDAT